MLSDHSGQTKSMKELNTNYKNMTAEHTLLECIWILTENIEFYKKRTDCKANFMQGSYSKCQTDLVSMQL